MAATTAQLDYAPGAPIRRRHRIRRTLRILFLFSLILTLWIVHRPIWRHVHLLYYQHQCLTYTAPPDQIVYDEDDAAPSPLIGTPGYQGLPAAPDFSVRAQTTNVSTVAVRPAPPLRGSFPGATVFLHELKTKAGLRRLVIVTRRPARFGPFKNVFALNVQVIIPAGLISEPPRSAAYLAEGFFLRPTDKQAPTEHLRFYAGQPDSADPAHFSIKYDLLNQSGMIEGRLQEDGETVTLRILTGPARNTNWNVTWPTTP